MHSIDNTIVRAHLKFTVLNIEGVSLSRDRTRPAEGFKRRPSDFSLRLFLKAHRERDLTKKIRNVFFGLYADHVSTARPIKIGREAVGWQGGMTQHEALAEDWGILPPRVRKGRPSFLKWFIAILDCLQFSSYIWLIDNKVQKFRRG